METVNFLWLVILGIVLVYVANFFVTQYEDFKRELRYINMEIERSDEDEKRLWKKQKQKLILSLIPFVRY